MHFVLILTTLFTVGEPLSPAEIRNAVESCVRSRGHTPGDSLVVEYRSAIPPVEEFGAGCIVVIRDGGTTRTKGNVTLPVELVKDGNVIKRFTVSIAIRTYGSVVVAARQLDRYELVLESDVESRYMETTSLPGDVVTSPGIVAGKRTTKIIGSGSVLTARWFERLPDIHRQDAVKLVAKGGSFLLSSAAVALEDGRIGESIRVRRQGSRGSMAATIVDATTVQITIGDN